MQPKDKIIPHEILGKLWEVVNVSLFTINNNTDTNYITDKLKNIFKKMNIELTVLSSYHYQSNGQEEACITFTNTQ